MSRVILKPIVSEKTVNLGRESRYAFWVTPASTKTEVKKALKELFKVEVERVNIIRLLGKRKRFRGTRGRRVERKKAIVTLQKGQKLPLFEEPKK